jgi:hypothetical protein
MLRLRHSQPRQRQLLQRRPLRHQALNQCPVWNGVKTGEPRGAPAVRSDAKHGAPAASSDVKHGAPLASSDVKRGAEIIFI